MTFTVDYASEAIRFQIFYFWQALFISRENDKRKKTGRLPEFEKVVED
jgi:hypothetical protein